MKKIFLCFVLLASSLPSHAVIIDDKDWRQLVDTAGHSFTYDQLTSTNTCNTVTGACNGILNGVDFTGWTWATNTDVSELFDFLNIGPDGYFNTNTIYTETDSSWADDIIDIAIDSSDTGLFLDTLSVDYGESFFGALSGITRSESGYAYLAYLTDDSTSADRAEITSIASDHGDASFGVWLYKSTPVSEPSTFLLFSLGLTGLSFLSCRNSTKT